MMDGDNTHSFKKIVVVKITENDERYLTLSPVSDSKLVSHPEFMAKEGGIKDGKNELTISLNDMLPYALDIPYTVGFSPHTTAATSDDFMMAGGTVTILAKKTSGTFDVGIIDDMLVEPTEYFTIQLGTPTYDDNHGFAATYNEVNFQDSKVAGIKPLSVSIMDNDTADTGGFVYLRGEGPSGPRVINAFPSTRRTLTESESTIITAEVAGTAPSSDIKIPLKVIGFPSDEVTSADYSIPESITIKSGEKSGSVTLTIKDDSDDERYRELLVVEIDGESFSGGYSKGDRSKYEVVMLDNDKTPASLDMLSHSALTEAAGAQTATFRFRIDRRPKADPPGKPPFTGEGADTKEVDAKLVLGYTGEATRGTDYKLTPNNLARNDGIVVRKSPAAPPDGCMLGGEAVTCTITLTVEDDNLYEGGPGTTEGVKIDLETGKSSFSGGLKKPASLDLTIADDDLQPMFSIADVSGPENGNLTFTVTRGGAPDNNVSVTAKTGDHASASVDNRATEGMDYAEKTETLRFKKGDTSETFVVAITDDNIDEPDETLAVTLSNPVDNQGLPKPAIADGKGMAVGTITDNDDAPTSITLSVDADTATNNVQTSLTEEGGAKMVRVTATIDGTTSFATEQTITVTVGKDGDSATKGTDYAMVEVQTIKIPIGAASAHVDFMLTPTSDVLFEGSETISVEGALTGVTFTNTAITITDDDAAPNAITLSVDTNAGGNGTPTSVGEEAGATTVRVTATIDGTTRFATEQTVTFELGKDEDSATEGADYTEVGPHHHD